MKKIAFIFCTCLIFNAFADDCPDGVLSCGTTDDGLSWEISEVTDENNHTIKQLTITGTGDMKDYTRGGDGIAPWRNPEYAGAGAAANSQIYSIVIGNGITSIGDHAFEDMWNVTSVSLPDGLKSVGREAYNWCLHLSEINLPSGIETLEPYAFYATNLEHIDLPANLKTIQSRAFGAATLSDITIPEGVNISPLAFEDEDGNAIVQNVYCSAENASCQALKNRESMAGKVQFYQKDGDGYFYKNRWYASPNDIIGDKHIKKRIYTIEEANKISKPSGNTLKIKYR